MTVLEWTFNICRAKHCRRKLGLYFLYPFKLSKVLRNGSRLYTPTRKNSFRDVKNILKRQINQRLNTGAGGLCINKERWMIGLLLRWNRSRC